MAVDLRIKSCLAFGHSVDALWVGTVRNVLTGFGRRGEESAAIPAVPTAREAAGELPMEQAAAVWLVDICGSSYADAAVELGCSREVIATSVAAGRVQIRQRLGR
jgi:hypothetical protein